MLMHQVRLGGRVWAGNRLEAVGDRYMVDLRSAVCSVGQLTSVWCAFRHTRFGLYTGVESPKQVFGDYICIKQSFFDSS
jgi:hypothetical protein